METILNAVRRARRRMVLDAALRLLPAALLAGSVVGAGLLLLHRWGRPVPWPVWPALAAAAAVGALAAALIRRPSLRTAAMALDRACRLDERLGAALFARDDGSPAAQALRRDAEESLRRVGRASVPLGRPGLRLLPFAAALLVAAFLVPIPTGASGDSPDGRSPDAMTPVPEPVRKEESARLRRRAFHLEKRAQELKDPELKDLAEAMRKLSEELRKDQVTREEALSKISTLEEKARNRKEELSSKYGEDLMKRLKGSGSNDPATEKKRTELKEKLSKMDSAAEALRDRLKEGKLTPEELKKLDEELKELARDLDETLGKDAPFAELQDQLEKLEGRHDGEGLDELREALGRLEEGLDDLELLELLEGELEDLSASKESLSEEEGNCPFCGKRGQGEKGGACARCRGLAAGDGPGGGPGRGTGGGDGRGPKGRAHEEDPLRPTQVRSPLSPGKIISAIQFKTLPEKGDVRSAYSEAYRHMSAEAAEALQQEEIPPAYRVHVRDYFDSIRPDKEKK